MSIIKINQNNFNDEVINSDKIVLIDFYADWCGPCKMLSPIIEQFASDNDDIKVCKINVDEENQISSQFGIMSIPTLVIVKDGKAIETSTGLKSKSQLNKMISAVK